MVFCLTGVGGVAFSFTGVGGVAGSFTGDRGGEGRVSSGWWDRRRSGHVRRGRSGVKGFTNGDGELCRAPCAGGIGRCGCTGMYRRRNFRFRRVTRPEPSIRTRY